MRHCTYYDAQFSRDGSYYALVCLGPSVPYVTLHRVMVNESEDSEDDNNDSGVGGEVDSISDTVLKLPNDSVYSFQFVALIENNTRLQVIFYYYFITHNK